MARPAVQRKPLCPHCGRSESVLRIAYGVPDDALRKEATDGVIVLGGYVSEYSSPAWFCRSCETSFGEMGTAA